MKLTGIYDTRVLCNRHSLYFNDELEEIILKNMHCVHEAEHNFTQCSGFLLNQHMVLGGSWNRKDLELLLSPQNLFLVSFPPIKFIFNSTWSALSCWTVRVMFFAPEYGEGDDEMPCRYFPMC